MKLSKMAIFYISIGLIIVGAFAFTRIKNSDFFAKKEKKSFTQTVEYQTVNEPSNILPTGVSYVKNSGRNGEMTSTFLFVYNDKGEVKSKKLVDEKYTIPVVNKVIVVGQKPLDEFSKGIRGKAQEFYNSYKDGKYTGASKWLKYVSGASEMPYSDDTIRDAVKDTQFVIKEITIGEPELNIPSPYDEPHKSLSEIKISAALPLQLKWSSYIRPEIVTDFKKTAFFDVQNNEWLFPPIGPVLSVAGSENSHFDATLTDNKTLGGLLRVEKIIQQVSFADSYNSDFSMVLVFDGKFDNDKKIKSLNYSNVRDDLGNHYSSGERASPFVDQDQKIDIGHVYTLIDANIKNIVGAKKLSIDITRLSDSGRYSWGSDNIDAVPRNFTITNISLR